MNHENTKNEEQGQPSPETSAANHNGGIYLITGLVILVALTIWISLLTLYASKDLESTYVTYLGAYGDFIGGMINPLLTFFTVIFLIYTIMQNQEMIRQNQKTITINTAQLENSTRELKNSTHELKLSQEALNKDAITNNLKFHFDIIKLVSEQIIVLADKKQFLFSKKSYSLSEMIVYPRYTRLSNMFKKTLIESIKDKGVYFDLYLDIEQLYKTYIDSVAIIVNEMPSIRWHFIQHPATVLIKNMDSFIDADKDDVYAVLRIHSAKQKTDSILIEKFENERLAVKSLISKMNIKNMINNLKP